MTAPVLIRVDASREVGIGHLARCMSLAGALRDLGGDVTFAMHAPAQDIVRRVEASGFACETIDDSVAPGSLEDAERTASIAKRLGGQAVLVADHYRIASEWERAMRPNARKLAVIDDLADRKHDCDILVDQNRPFDGAAAYEGLVPAGCKLLIGPKFAMLRREFAEWRARPRQRDGRIERLLICFGGSDPGGHTLVVLRALAPMAARIEHVDVVVGPLNSSVAEITAAASAFGAVTHVDPPDLAGLMHAADLAIGGGGVISWERLCLSLPALAVGIVSNQAQNIRDLTRLGVALGTPQMFEPNERLYAQWLGFLLDTPDLVRGMGERARPIVDGEGALRVARQLLKSRATLRRATPGDSVLVHRWRNDPSTRAVSSNSAEIAFADHDRWYASSLANPSRLILIAEVDGTPVGVARFDLAQDEATISVYKDPQTSIAFDLVAEATNWLFLHEPGIVRIRATVLATNARSTGAFEAAGYRLDERHYVAERP